MKWFFTFLIFLAVTSFSADLVCKLIDVSTTSKALSLPEEEDTDEPSEEEEDPEGKIKLREYDWFCSSIIDDRSVSNFSDKIFLLVFSDQIIEQPSFSVPFSPPEMS